MQPSPLDGAASQAMEPAAAAAEILFRRQQSISVSHTRTREKRI